jgi:hypothetical protein
MEGDRDDEVPGPQGVRRSDEVTITTLNLLVTVLEGALFQ